VEAMIEKAKPEQVQLVGLLEELNGPEEITGRLREAGGGVWVCRFRRQDISRIAEAWMRRIEVSGRSQKDARPPEVEVDAFSIVGAGENDAEREWNSGPSFEESPSIEDLAREQGVLPITDVDAVGDLWPRDDDPDELLAFILDEGKSA
jgi:hypothetical protein